MPAVVEPVPCPGSAGERLFQGESSGGGDEPVYSATFWIAYVANVSVVTANALTFRFAELVDFLGGREQIAGMIVGIATAVALVARATLGQSLDRYGVRRLWILSTLIFTAGGAILTVADSLSWSLYAGRSLFAVGLAGLFTCSTVHIQNLVPPHRRTEVIGSLGSSGFLGMILGAILGDVIFHSLAGGLRFTVLFGAATTLGVWYLALVLYLTRSEQHVSPSETPALHRLVVRHWPGNVMLVAFVIGMMFAVTSVFLTRFATDRGLSGLGPFFGTYAAAAFLFRLVSRNWSRTVGRHRMILLGLAGHATAASLLPFVTAEWMFTIPAFFGGFGHALLFPAVVSLGSEAFPREYRGTGTTLVMGFMDVGTFVSAPVLGLIIDRTGFTPMLATAATVALGVAVIYVLTSARTPDSDFVGRPSGSEPSFAGTSATKLSASRFSPIEPFARGASATGTSADERSVPAGTGDELSAREGIAVGPSAHESSETQPSAREGIRPAIDGPRPGRASATVPATRCR